MIAICQYCGTEFKTSPSRNQKFCTISCGLKARRIEENSVFQEFSSESAYILGLLITDGCISYSKHSSMMRMSIAMSERDVMIEVHNIISPQKQFKSWSCKTSRQLMYEVTSFNQYDIDYLKSIGIEERKTYTVRLPQQIPYEQDMLRGIFDGDGSAFVNVVKGHKYVHVAITTGSEGFANDLCNVFARYEINSSIVVDSRRKNCEKKTYYVKIYSKEDIRKFYELLYGNNPSIFCSRKKAIFDSVI